MDQEKFYLTSSESSEFSDVRTCYLLGSISYQDKTAGPLKGMLIAMNPGIFRINQDKGRVEIKQLILFPRHVGYGLFPVKQWPVHVYAYQILNENVLTTKQIENNNDVLKLSWAELHNNLQSAKKVRDLFHEMNDSHKY